MMRKLWMTTLAVGLLAVAGAAAAGGSNDATAPRDAAGLSGPRWGGGPCGAPCIGTGPHGHGHAMGAKAACGQGQKTQGCCGHGQGMQDCCGHGQSVRGCRGHAMGPQAMGPHAMAPRAMRSGPRAGGPGAAPGAGFGHGAMAKLDLSETQREKLADLHERTLKTNIQARADLRVAQLDLRKLMRAETPDARAIEAQIDKLAGLRAAIQKTRVKALLDARSVLTPEQQKQLRELRGPGGGRGPGPWGWMGDEPGPGGDAWDGPEGEEGNGEE